MTNRASRYWLKTKELESAIQRVRKLHSPLVKKAVLNTVETFCIHCDHFYPCPTIEELDTKNDN